MLEKPIKAVLFAVLIWLTGFIWGSFVFVTPGLKEVPGIPYVSRNLAISLPILILWLPLTYFLARNYLNGISDKVSEGLKLGLVFAGTNVLLDTIVLVFLFGAGFSFFAAVTVLIAYGILFFVPYILGRRS